MRELACYTDHNHPRLKESLRLVADTGFKYLCSQDSMEWIETPHEKKLEILKAARDTAENAGLKFLAYHSCWILLPLQESQSRAVQMHKLFLDEIKELGATVWVLHNRSVRDVAEPWLIRASVGAEEFDKLTVQVLKEAARYAAQYGISIAVENLPLPDVYRVRDTLDIVEAVGEPNVGLCLDSGHSNAVGMPVPGEVEAAGKKLFTTHFHDNFGSGGLSVLAYDQIGRYDRHLMPGLGIIDWVAVNRSLNRIGYDKPIAFEGIRGIDDQETLLRTTVTLWRTFEKLAEIAPAV